VTSAWESMARYRSSAIIALLLVPFPLRGEPLELPVSTPSSEFISRRRGVRDLHGRLEHAPEPGQRYLLFLGRSLPVASRAARLITRLASKGMGVCPGTRLRTSRRSSGSQRGAVREPRPGPRAASSSRRRAPASPHAARGALVSAHSSPPSSSAGTFRTASRRRRLTPFKIASEYVIVLLIGGPLVLLRRRRDPSSPRSSAALGGGPGPRRQGSGRGALVHPYRRRVRPHEPGSGTSSSSSPPFSSTRLSWRPASHAPFDFSPGSASLKRRRGRRSQEENRVIAAAREALERKNAQYASSSPENELLGIAAHDIRSPLSVGEMYSSFLRESHRGGRDAEGPAVHRQHPPGEPQGPRTW